MAHISDSSAELVKAFNLSEWEIGEHCASLRQKIDIARETKLENIHKAYNKLMSEIDAYERDCLSCWAPVKESTKNVVEGVSKRMREFVAEQQAFLQSGQASGTQSIYIFLLNEKVFFESKRSYLFEFVTIYCLFSSYFLIRFCSKKSLQYSGK